MKLIKYDNVPRRYQLLWDDIRKTIIVRIHRDCLKYVRVIPATSPWLYRTSETHGLDTLFDSFSGDFRSGRFGFNNVLTQVGVTEPYLDFAVLIPQVKILTVYACQECAGTGSSVSEWNTGQKCHYCDGAKVVSIYDWRSAYAVTATLSLLSNILEFEEETSSDEVQHISLRILASHGQHGSSLGGDLGIDFMDCVCALGDTDRDSITKQATTAMRTVHKRMCGEDETYRIRATCDAASFGFTVPGNACGVSTGFYEHQQGQGRDFDCHNVDSPLQSLTLLAGIASFLGQIDFLIHKAAD